MSNRKLRRTSYEIRINRDILGSQDVFVNESMCRCVLRACLKDVIDIIHLRCKSSSRQQDSNMRKTHVLF